MGFPSTAMLVAVLRAASLLLFQGFQIPAPVGLVNDFAQVIEPEAAQRMERIAEDVRAKSPGEIAIVTLPDIGNRDVQEVGRDIGRQWKIGQPGKPGDPTRNAGAVIVLVPKETSKDGRGHCFVATGYGAEGFITDAVSGTICREATPLFAAQDYSTGLELVTLRTAERFAKEFNFSLDTALVPPQVAQPAVDYAARSSRGIPPFVWFILFLIVLSLLSGGRRRGRKGCGGCIPIPIIIPTGGFGGGGRGGW
ncbi:MAG TPA: TPM domain-containing protein, partial [Gemmatimonadaceae bacterium]|nr:TPM domain-containing protein [Gemmatimonadaceae bacterium]